MKRRHSLLVLFMAVAVAGLFWQRHFRLSNLKPAPTLQIRNVSQPVFSPAIRVNLTATPVSQIQMAIDGPFQIKPVGSSQILGTGDSLKETTVTTTRNGFRIGNRDYAVSRLEFVPTKSPAIWIDNHQYRGRIRLYRQPGGKLIAVNVLPLQDYIASVVDSEMPASFSHAARQAQAVVARTYALYQMQAAKGNRQFDLYATPRSQKYLGYQYRDAQGKRLAGESQSSRQVVRETAGMVCTWNGELFCTYYSAVCGGRTTGGLALFSDAAPPVRSVECNWCRKAGLYRWKAEVAKTTAADDLRRYFTANGKPFDQFKTIQPRSNNSPGTIPEFDVSDGRRQYTIKANVLRRQLTGVKLHSHNFTVYDRGEKLVFEGQGHGHGIGLCQWGASGLGQTGRSCLQILAYYYPGSKTVIIEPDGT